MNQYQSNNEQRTNKAILVVSFGTSYKENIQKTIGAVENGIKGHFTDYSVFRAFTSPTIRRKLWEKEQIQIKSPEEMIAELKELGYSELIIQPTFLIQGFEFDKLRETVNRFQNDFAKLVLGTPLLYEESDILAVCQCLKDIICETQRGEWKTADWIFMGHGTEHEADIVYQRLQCGFKELGMDRVWIGTVEGSRSLSEIQKERQKKSQKQVVLHPLLLVSGEHANRDMAGDEERSWKMILKSQGNSVACVLKGVGEYPKIQELYVKKIHHILDVR